VPYNTWRKRFRIFEKRQLRRRFKSQRGNKRKLDRTARVKVTGNWRELQELIQQEAGENA
jgi:hypothetical protein